MFCSPVAALREYLLTWFMDLAYNRVKLYAQQNHNDAVSFILLNKNYWWDQIVCFHLLPDNKNSAKDLLYISKSISGFGK